MDFDREFLDDEAKQSEGTGAPIANELFKPLGFSNIELAQHKSYIETIRPTSHTLEGTGNDGDLSSTLVFGLVQPAGKYSFKGNERQRGNTTALLRVDERAEQEEAASAQR